MTYTAFDTDNLRIALRNACKQAGGIAAWARRHGVHPNTVQHVLDGQNGVSDKIAGILGFRRMILYTRVDAGNDDGQHGTATGRGR